MIVLYLHFSSNECADFQKIESEVVKTVRLIASLRLPIHRSLNHAVNFLTAKIELREEFIPNY